MWNRSLRRWLMILAALGLTAFLFSPRNLGPLPEYRIVAWLKYWGVMPPRVRLADVLADDLHAKQERVYLEAAQSVGLLPADPRSTTALLQFIDRPDVSAGAKDVAIWSLGELRVEDALPRLRSRLDNPELDQENLQRAITKIEQQTPKGWFPD